MSHYGSNFRNEEPIREKSRETVTNILLLDTTTLISILVMVVFIIKLFNKVIETNSVGTLPTSGRKKRNVFPSARKLVKYRSDFRRRRIFSPPPFSQHQGPPRYFKTRFFMVEVMQKNLLFLQREESSD